MARALLAKPASMKTGITPRETHSEDLGVKRDEARKQAQQKAKTRTRQQVPRAASFIWPGNTPERFTS